MKSNCRKKYCDCFDAGVPCGPRCNCVDCENTEGHCGDHADGSVSLRGLAASRAGASIDDPGIDLLKSVEYNGAEVDVAHRFRFEDSATKISAS